MKSISEGCKMQIRNNSSINFEQGIFCLANLATLTIMHAEILISNTSYILQC